MRLSFFNIQPTSCASSTSIGLLPPQVSREMEALGPWHLFHREWQTVPSKSPQASQTTVHVDMGHTVIKLCTHVHMFIRRCQANYTVYVQKMYRTDEDIPRLQGDFHTQARTRSQKLRTRPRNPQHTHLPSFTHR